MDEFGYIWLRAIQANYKQLTETGNYVLHQLVTNSSCVE